MSNQSNTLREIYTQRFGEKFSENLDIKKKLQIDFRKENHITTSPNRCQKCNCYSEKEPLRQDLPFWIDDIQKDFMIIAQDAGKGVGDDFNTVFSIHTAYNNRKLYTGNKKHDNYFTYIQKLVCIEKNHEDELFLNIFLTDLVKCCFSFRKGIKISLKKDDDKNKNAVKCHTDILTEIAEVKPKIVYLFGQKPRDTFKKLIESTFKDKKVVLLNSYEIIINKGRKTTIQIFTHPEFKEILFIAVPQLGNNRFAKENYTSLFETLDNKLKPIIKKHFAKN